MNRLPGSSLVAWFWVGSVSLSALILATPYLQFAYRSRDLHVAVNVVDGCIALLTAYLLLGRFLRSNAWRDGLLLMGMALLAAAGIAAPLTDALVYDVAHGTLDAWLPMGIRTIAAALVAAAALVGGVRLVPRSSMVRGAVAALIGILIGGTFLLWSLRGRLPQALNPELIPTDTQLPTLSGHPMQLLLELLVAACFAAASLRFGRDASRSDDELLRWVGPACALASVSRVLYSLFPSTRNEWLYTADLFRTAFYLLLLIGAAREIRNYWQAQAEIAVAADRRRMARDLHDGVLQELVFIRGRAFSMPENDQNRLLVLDAAGRASDEIRGAVHALAADHDESLPRLLRRAADGLAARHGAGVLVDLDEHVDVPVEHRQSLVRILREAALNAVRHGTATTVRVSLYADDDGRHLVVADDGEGFDPGRVSASGFGLTSMRERAERIGATLVITSAHGAGTRVEVTW